MNRGIPRIVAAAILACVISVVGSPAAHAGHASPSMPKSQYDTFRLANQVNGQNMCLDARAQDYGQNGTVQLWHCNGNANQAWYPITLNNIPVYMNGQSLGGTTHYCLQFQDAPPHNGTVVRMWTCRGSSWQHWDFNFNISDQTQRPYDYGGYCLDAKSSNLGDGDTIRLWTCNGTPVQNWVINLHTS